MKLHVSFQKPPVQLDAFQVAISARDTKWNDFGFNYRVTLEVRKPGDRDYRAFSAFMIPFRNMAGEEFYTEVGEFMADNKGNVELCALGESPLPHYFILLSSLAEYTALAAYIENQGQLRDLLAGMNDVVLMRSEGRCLGLVSQLERTREFSLGVLRDAAAYKSYYRASSVLKAEVLPPNADAFRDFRFACKLEGFSGAPHFLSVDASDGGLFPERAQCLIGPNGSGKTRLLKSLAEELRTSTSRQGVTRTGPDGLGFEGQPFKRIVAFSFDGSGVFNCPDSKDSVVEYLAFDLRRGGTGAVREEPTEGTPNSIARLLVHIIRAGVRDGEELDLRRFSILSDTLSDCLPFDRLCLPVHSESDLPATFLSNGERWAYVNDISRMYEMRMLMVLGAVDERRDIAVMGERGPIPLSSGQNIYLRFAVHFLSFIEADTLTIIDEPETHLHPNLISGFMYMLRFVLEATRSLALIATHSPFVVREVAREAVHVYRLVGGDGVEVLRPTLKTLGASVDEISDAVFGDYTATKYIDVIVQAAMSEKGRSGLEPYRNKLNPAVLAKILLRRELGE